MACDAVMGVGCKRAIIRSVFDLWLMTMTDFSTSPLQSRWQAAVERLRVAALAANRPAHAVTLLAVSKTFGAQAVAEVHAAGQTAFGENYIQEAVDKIQALSALRAQLEWHCIGPIQSNKTRLVAEHFDWVQTVDRLKIAQRLNEQRPDSMAALQVCIQVNVDGGHTKSGIALDEADALAEAVRGLPHLRLRGLMCIPDPVTGFDAQCAVFARAQAVFNRWQQRGWEVDTLSMGMSGDLEAAVASGATMVRVGSAIFGARSAA
jgi:PLP dependent protein